jgi:hypothetical protein
MLLAPFDMSLPPVEIRFIPATSGRSLTVKASLRHPENPFCP